MAHFLPRRWKRQPAGPLVIDWNHPLSWGLAHCFDVRNLVEVRSQRGLTVVSGTKYCAAGSDGSYVVNTRGFGPKYGGGSSDLLTIPQAPPLLGNVTIGWAYMRYAADEGSGFGRILDWPTTSGSFVLYDSGGVWEFDRPWSTSGATYVTGQSPGAEGETHVDCLAVDALPSTNEWTWIHDGVMLTGTSRSQGTGSVLGFSGNMSIGNRSSDQLRNWGGTIELICIWDRKFTPGESIAWAENRYQIFSTPRTRLYWLGIPAAGAGNVITAPLGQLTLSGLAPSFSQGNTLAAPLGQLTLSGLAPSFSQGNSLGAPLGTLTLSGLAPSFVQTSGNTLTAPLGQLTLGGLAPAFGQSNTLTVPLGQLSLVGMAASFTQTGPNIIGAPLGQLNLVGFDASFVQTGVGGYGGVWLYGLKHWQRLRAGQHVEDEDEEIPLPVVAEIATVVNRIPTPATPDDTEAKLLLRLELERKNMWRAAYVDALKAYREGYAEALEEAKQARANREVESLRETAERVKRKRRRMAIMLLLSS